MTTRRKPTPGKASKQGSGATRGARRARDGERPTSATPRFIVLTGLSGAGKPQPMPALEAPVSFCVDTLPITLLPIFAELTLRPDTEIEKAAVVIDVREGGLLDQFPHVFEALRARQDVR